jgi:O-antigen/teichoic acid export membrane protein
LTVPALSIKGEIGQQLGYIVAGSAVAGTFVLLIVIGWMYSHKRETFRFFQWITRGRFRPPPDDEYRY